MPSKARKLLEERRLQGVGLLNRGKSVAEVARLLGVSWSAVAKWRDAVRTNGEKALKTPKNQFRAPPLDDAQLRRIGRALRRRPEQEGFTDHVWTLPLVALLIGRKAHYYEKVSRWTARRVLHHLGFRCAGRFHRRRKDATAEPIHWLPPDSCENNF